ncbi:MAG: alpha/beta hydrolase [Lachnotalea sp.]
MKIKSKLKYIILFGTVITISISIINKFIEISATLKNKLSTNKAEYFDWRFGKIFYTKQGTGSPILLIHDLDVCSSSTEWKHIIKHLSLNHTVYTLDLLGCGLSDKPYLTYTNYLYVQLLSDFIKNIIGHKTNVIASGSSSTFTIMTCHNDSNLFNKIMIVNPVDLFDANYVPRNKSISLKILFDTPILGTLIFNILNSRSNIETSLNKKVHNFININSDYIDDCYEAAHIQNSKGKYLFASIKGSFTNANILHALKEINNSIFVVGGNYQYNINNIIENYLYYNSSIESFIINNSKQYPHIEASVTFLEQVSIFIDN